MKNPVGVEVLHAGDELVEKGFGFGWKEGLRHVFEEGF